MLKLNVDLDQCDWSGYARLLREKQVKGDPVGAKRREAPEPPAESERPERKSTGKNNKANF
jgi:hypothetical protein